MLLPMSESSLVYLLQSRLVKKNTTMHWGDKLAQKNQRKLPNDAYQSLLNCQISMALKV